MRVLIVDDDKTKVNSITDFLLSHGLNSHDVVCAEDAAEARKLLTDNTYDLMLLDVLLPARKGSTPSGEHSVELLKQIIDDGTSNAPKYIVGITAELDAVKRYDTEFKSLVLQLLYVAPGDSTWKDSLKSCLSFIKRANEASNKYDYDICVINALRTPELEAIYDFWPLELNAEQCLSNSIMHRTGVLRYNDKNLRIACAYLSQMGPVAAVHASELVLSKLRPRILLMTGICGGLPGQGVSIGDVVVAEKSWDWQAGKWNHDGSLSSASDQKEASQELVSLSRGIDSVVTRFHKEFSGNKPDECGKLVVGPMVTGSAVVASTDFQKIFIGQHRKMAAIDMECYGLYYATKNHDGPETKVICIKSVADLADRAKSDGFQKYCSYLSARVGLELVQRYFG